MSTETRPIERPRPLALPNPDEDAGRANRIHAERHLRKMRIENPERYDHLQRDWDEAEGITAVKELRALAGERAHG